MGELLLVHFVAVLACARLTRLVTTDTLTAPLRARLEVVAGTANAHFGWVLVRELVTCRWCVGYWIGLFGSAGALAVRPIPDSAWWLSVVPVSLAYSILIVVTLGVTERLSASVVAE